jgi:DNA-binding CsgD family transcriptional regulator
MLPTIKLILDLSCLAACGAAFAVCRLWQAWRPHPLFRISAWCFACLGSLSFLSLYGAGAGLGATGLPDLRALWSRSLAEYFALVLTSALQAPVLLLLCRLFTEAAQAEWQGWRRRFPQVVAGGYLAASGIVFIILPLPGDWPMTLIQLIVIGVDWVVKPLYILALGLAITGAMLHIPDCPWPAIRRMLARWWPLPAILSLMAFASLWLPFLGSSLTVLVLGAALLAVRLGRSGLQTAALDAAKPVPLPAPKPESADRIAAMERLAFTPREREVCLRLLDGWTYSDIAGFLGIASTTVKTHVQNSYRKAGVANKLELARFLR